VKQIFSSSFFSFVQVELGWLTLSQLRFAVTHYHVPTSHGYNRSHRGSGSLADAQEHERDPTDDPASEHVGTAPHAPHDAVNAIVCLGCGACAATCPSRAINLRHFTFDQVMAQVDTLVDELLW